MAKSLILILTALLLETNAISPEWFQTWNQPEYQEWATPIPEGYLLHIIRKEKDTWLVAQAKLLMGDEGLPGFEVVEQNSVANEETAQGCIHSWRRERSSPLDEVKERIIASLSYTLKPPPPQPLLVLIGGYVGSGKSTLSKAMKERYKMTVFSLNAIRQAMLDEGVDIRKNKKEEREIFFDVYPKLLGPCISRQQDIVIDANANGQGIQEALEFLRTHPGGDQYRIVKIHLRASEEELYTRVNARIQRPDLHQGTKEDLDYELSTPSKAIYPEDYDLIIDTETTTFDEEMEVVNSLLQSRSIL